MPSSESTTIGELLAEHGGDVQTGPFGTKLKASEYTPTGVPVISVGEVGYGRLRLHEKTPRVDSTVTDRMPEYLLQHGDIVFGRKGAVDRSARVQPDQDGWFLGSDGIRLRLPASCDSAFIAYQLQLPSHRAWMLQHAAGSTMPSLNEGIIRRIPIVLPELDEQRAIAAVLGALDDKIEQNRRTGRALEGLARATFKAWFVDFEPVKTKAAGQTSFPGMPPAAFAALPDRLTDSPLGPVPQGWEVRSIEEVSERVGMGPFGSSIKVSTFRPQGIPVISGQHLNGLMLEDSTFNFIAEEHADRLRAANVFRGDIILTHAGNVGQVSYIPETSRFERYVISQRQFFIRCNGKRVSPRYMAYWFHSAEGQHALKANMSQTGVPSLARPVTYVRSLPVLTPCSATLAGFETVVGGIDRLRAHMAAESSKLAALRDYLLPRLLSGRVRVREAEAKVGEIA
jgi:type I restriction enzyme, S subunit